MNISKPPNGKISIHEPLEIDKEHPEEIFDRDILKRSKLADHTLNHLWSAECPPVLGICRGRTRASKELVFSLALLCHACPEFYQRFSSVSETYIRGILDNFFLPETVVQAKETLAHAILPLLKDYVEGWDLPYFIKTAFSEYLRSRNSFILQLIDGISGLRETGLP